MEITPNETGEGEKRAMLAKRGCEDGVKHTRYTEQKIEALEKVYADFPNPNSVQRAQMLLEQPALSGLDNKQLKVWFQNRRCREKLKKENAELVEENKKLALSIRVIKEENDVLQERVAELLHDNEYMQNIFLNV